jgi:hypothetical protein
LIEALCEHFNMDRLKYEGVEIDKEETLNLCQEIVKLMEITDPSPEDMSFIT